MELGDKNVLDEDVFFLCPWCIPVSSPRDWIHVNDVVSAIGHLIPSTYTGHIDIGTGEETSVLELAEAMGMGHLPIKEDTPGEPDSLCADTRSLRDLGWFPTINIMDTVKNNV